MYAVQLLCQLAQGDVAELEGFGVMLWLCGPAMYSANTLTMQTPGKPLEHNFLPAALTQP